MESVSSLRRAIEDKTAQVTVIGLGYVGLPVACKFAEAGFRVVGVDVAADRVTAINAGRLSIEGKEPGLAGLLRAVVGAGRLVATTDAAVVRETDIVLVAVETPVETTAPPTRRGALPPQPPWCGGERTYRRPAYKALRAAAASVGDNLRPGGLVIVESTIAPGTVSGVVRPLLEQASGLTASGDFFLAHCPERVMVGRLLANLESCARVVGGWTPEAAELAVAFYRHVVRAALDATDCLTAELVKTAENAYRDVQIAFANEVALLCENVGANVYQVRELVNKSPYRQMHMPGAGVGGHCISKDPWLLIHGAAGPNLARLMPVARMINDGMPLHVADLARAGLAEAGREVTGARVLVLGYAFREDSDDRRNTPTDPLVARLQEWGAEVTIHDPYVTAYATNWETCAAGADIVVVMVRHSQYCGMELARLASLMRTLVLIDGRNVFDRDEARRAGFVYKGVGNVG